jgi:hypothetical protein
MPNLDMVNVSMLSDIMLNVVLLSVVALFKGLRPMLYIIYGPKLQ